MNKALVIVGNGFDKFHGLKTSYGDFKKFLEQKYPRCVEQIEEYIDITKYTGVKDDDLWKNLEANLAEVDYKIIYEEALALYVPYSNHDWKDRYNHDFQCEMSKNLFFARNLAKYAKEWINGIKINGDTSLTNFIAKHKYYLSFNYTDTLEVLYNVSEEDIFYIHGKAKRDENIIFGHNTECGLPELINPEEDIRITEGNIILCNSQNALKKHSEIIIDANKKYFESLKNIKNVYVLGHSLSEVDNIYFANMIKYLLRDCQWYASWYSDDDIKNIDKFAIRNNMNNKIKKIRIEDLI